MTNLLLLIPVALGLGLLGLLAFFWFLKSGQMDDPDGAAMRILVDDVGLDARSVDRTPGSEVRRDERDGCPIAEES